MWETDPEIQKFLNHIKYQIPSNQGEEATSGQISKEQLADMIMKQQDQLDMIVKAIDGMKSSMKEMIRKTVIDELKKYEEE